MIVNSRPIDIGPKCEYGINTIPVFFRPTLYSFIASFLPVVILQVEG